MNNSDFPQNPNATAPLNFPRPQIDPCARITTRVYDPRRNETTTVQNVLVRTMIPKHNRNADDTDDDTDDSSDMSESSSDEDAAAADATTSSSTAAAAAALPSSSTEERAYWLQRTLREAIYGRVRQGVILRRRLPRNASLSSSEAEWEVTNRFCAVKEMSWQHIQRNRGRLAEDPITEIAAMQYLAQRLHQQSTPDSFSVESTMTHEHVIVPLDLLSDEKYLYSVLPYCNGGELFDRLEQNEKFTEREARYWMRQILNGINCLHVHGICHRDISLENLLVNNGSCLIIDLGMCLRIPYDSLNDSLRLLITPQGTCGKWHYMSPEIALNRTPFDGHAVDLWAAGVILFLMLTGFPPWERPLLTDDRFRYMTAGYLTAMLTEWRLELSNEAMDLLQGMLWFDPRDRLSLRQVYNHPWILNDDVVIPTDIN